MLDITNPRQTVLITARANVDILGKDTEKDNVANRDEPEETENQEPEKETPEEEEVL